MSFIKEGCQTIFVYSKRSLTMEVYNLFIKSQSRYVNVLLISPNNWFAFMAAWVTWIVGFTVQTTHTPRSFSSVVSYSVTRFPSGLSLIPPRCIVLHFSILNLSCHFFDQSTNHAEEVLITTSMEKTCLMGQSKQ